MSLFNNSHSDPLAASAFSAISRLNRMAYGFVNRALVIERVSSDFARLTGRTPEEITGRPVTEALLEFVGAEEPLQAVLDGQSPQYRLEFVHQNRPGETTRYLSFQATPLGNGSQIEGLLLVVEDVTRMGELQQHLVQERNELRILREELAKANEDLVNLSRLKSLFLSIAAHDLRTPLASIRGFAELLHDSLPAGPSQQRDMIEVISSQSDRLQHLISDFLDLDQLEQGRLTMVSRECFLDEIISDVVASMRPLISRRDIELTVDFAERPLVLQADYERLSQIVYNLIGNAIKYTSHGGWVKVEGGQEGEKIVIRVADNGQGMTEEQMGNLFSLYYRTEEARQSQGDGSGLGLFIVKMLVEAHQGAISVDSHPGRGSVFTVRLPTENGR